MSLRTDGELDCKIINLLLVKPAHPFLHYTLIPVVIAICILNVWVAIRNGTPMSISQEGEKQLLKLIQ